jgi:hypothetical protein
MVLRHRFGWQDIVGCNLVHAARCATVGHKDSMWIVRDASRRPICEGAF